MSVEAEVTVFAIDCDLRQSYGVTDSGVALRAKSPCALLQDLGGGVTKVLFEIASPVSFNRGPGSSASMYQLAKWAIWNVAQATLLSRICQAAEVEFLVSPSDVWTHGYKLEVRHAMAKACQPKKDLRECEAMLWFYQKAPAKWLPLDDFLGDL